MYNAYGKSWGVSYSNSWGNSTVIPPVVQPSIGGGRILKPEYYSKTISLEDSKSGYFYLNTKPNDVEESSKSYSEEINRFNTAIETLNIQIESAKLELDIFGDKLNKELINIDIIYIQQFIEDLLLQIEVLFLLKRRRKEEEELILILTSIYI